MEGLSEGKGLDFGKVYRRLIAWGTRKRANLNILLLMKVF